MPAARAPARACSPAAPISCNCGRPVSARPHVVVDIGDLPLDGDRAARSGLAIGALARLSDVADHPLIRERLPGRRPGAAGKRVAASAQRGDDRRQPAAAHALRLFPPPGMPCDKRAPGSGCGARDGENRLHAIFGAGRHCVATHPSDLAVALSLWTRRCGCKRPRRTCRPDRRFLSSAGRHAAARDGARPGELIVAVELPAATAPLAFVKVRDRASFEFALVSVAAALDTSRRRDPGGPRRAGGVGTKPWRLPACEAVLLGAPRERHGVRQRPNALPMARSRWSERLQAGIAATAVLARSLRRDLA